MMHANLEVFRNSCFDNDCTRLHYKIYKVGHQDD